MSLEPVPALQGARPYSPPRHPAPVWLKLDANEWSPPPPHALVRKPAIQSLNRYPSARELEQEIASRHGIGPERVLVTAGADEALDRLCRAMLGPGRRLAVTWPTFEMLPKYAALAGATIDRIPWHGDEPFPREAMIRAIGPDTRVVAVVTPNSPTGTVASAGDLRALSAAAPHACLLVDLAYTEFADVDLTPEALALRNAVATRTFSKYYGLAGARVGYAMGNADVIAWMRAAGGPYSVAGVSLEQALHAYRSMAPPGHLDGLRQSRAALRTMLRENGWEVPDSRANFILARNRRAPWLRDALASRGISVRAFPGHPELHDAVRITLTEDPVAMQTLQAAVRQALVPSHVSVSESCAALLPRLPFPRGTEPDGTWRFVSTPQEIEPATMRTDVVIAFAPGATPDEEHALLAAGAARVLRSIDDLKEILP